MTQHAPEERGTPGLDYPPMPDYPPATDYSSMPERTARPSYPLLPDRRENLLARQEEILARQEEAPGREPRTSAAGVAPPAEPTGGQPPAEPARPGDTLADVFQPAAAPPAAAQPTAAPPAAGQLAAGPPRDSQAEQAGETGPDVAPPAGEADEPRARLAMLAYLTVPIFGPVVPLVGRLRAGRASPWLRGHATQALNVWLTVFIYDIAGAIMGAMLALDSPWVAVGVMVPLMVLLWGVAIARLVRAATAASEGGTHTLPRWLCSQIVH